MKSLSSIEIELIEKYDCVLEKISKIQEKFSHIRLDDVLVRETTAFGEKPTIDKNNLGHPFKFKVVHISRGGIPFIKLIGSNGNVKGDLIFLDDDCAFLEYSLEEELARGHRFNVRGDSLKHRFLPDPDQLDAILLEQEYKPMALQREETSLLNEINKYNKKIIVKTNWCDRECIRRFFQNLKSGELFWMSSDKSLLFYSMNKVKNIYTIDCKDSNGVPRSLVFSNFFGRRLYKEKPRSFSRERKT